MKKIGLAVLVVSWVMATTAVAAEFSADMISVVAGGKDISKMYFRPPNISRNEAMGMVIIVRPPSVYHLFPDRKEYVVTNIEEIKKQNPMADAENFEQWLQGTDLQKVGVENIQGFQCDVYEGEATFMESQPPAFMKIWYSKKLAYPIKTESTLKPPMGKVSNYLENITVGRLADSLFEVPSGYTEEKDLQKAMMGSDFQPPTAQGSGQAPSREEMEKMMQQMQELMKKTQKQ